MKHIYQRMPVDLMAALCMAVIFLLLASCSQEQRYAAPPVEGENIVLSLAALPIEIPQHYSLRTKGKYVDFFVLRMQDRILSFLDACLTCYPQKRGYASREGFVVCRACDTAYSVYKLEKGIGGCYPIRIEGRLENGRYVIARSTLERHAGKF